MDLEGQQIEEEYYIDLWWQFRYDFALESQLSGKSTWLEIQRSFYSFIGLVCHCSFWSSIWKSVVVMGGFDCEYFLRRCIKCLWLNSHLFKQVSHFTLTNCFYETFTVFVTVICEIIYWILHALVKINIACYGCLYCTLVTNQGLSLGDII